jgi:ApbE superfamily uncharacterized protein (UPF0280 family)
MQATRQALSNGRWHFQHGPIDIVLQIDGESSACEHALQRAWERFETVLPELVSELAALRRPVAELKNHCFQGEVARRMHQATADLAWASPDGFVTPMAAVAGSVAQEVMQALVVPGVDRAYVNNGGDIALHVQHGEWRIGIVSQLAQALATDASSELVTDGHFVIRAEMPVRGVATSGWGGRSFSFGVADSVTVLADTAALADVAATLIANAVNVQHPGIQRRPANSLSDDTDLGDRLVTVDVPRLPVALIQGALQLGLDCARGLQARGQLHAAFLSCQGQVAVTPVLECLV